MTDPDVSPDLSRRDFLVATGAGALALAPGDAAADKEKTAEGGLQERGRDVLYRKDVLGYHD